jgi:hypothetical protein
MDWLKRPKQECEKTCVLVKGERTAPSYIAQVEPIGPQLELEDFPEAE